MAGADESAPVRRGPGRPRKVVEEPKSEETPQLNPLTDPEDPRIGETCDPDWSVVAFSDTGYMYRCENGVVVERVR